MTDSPGSTPLMGSHGSTAPYRFGPELYIYLYVMLAVSAIGVVANIFAIVVLVKMPGQRGCLLIIHQSVCDITACLTLIVTFALALTVDGQLTGFVGGFLCWIFLTETLFLACFTASTFNLVAITLERYLAVVHPFTHRAHFTKKAAYWMMGVTWLAAILYKLPHAVTSTVENGYCLYDILWPSSIYHDLYYYAFFIGTFAIPLCILLYCYTHILVVLYRKRSPPSVACVSHSKVISRAQLSLTKTMIVVSVAFAITVTPHQVYYSGYQLLLIDKVFGHCYALMAVSLVNCLVNPFIYVFTCSAFRKGAWALLRCKTLDGVSKPSF